MTEEQSSISFPPGAVADEPVRVPLLWNGEGAIALNKRPGLAAFQDSRVGGGPRSILAGINKRTPGEESQFQRLGIETLFSVNLLEREISGCVLYAKKEETRSQLKNAMGSSQFIFRYHFISFGECEADEISCDLPVAVHRQKSVALISHKTGKKTVTHFRRLRRLGAGALWESASPYDRFHQVRLHAAEVGLPILGDALYENTGRGAVGKKMEGKVAGDLLDGGPCLHLFGLRFPLDDSGIDLEAPYHRELDLLVKKLSL